MNYYMEISLKILVTLILLLLYARLSGLKQLAPVTVFDNIANMMVGAIAGTTLLNRNVSVMDSAVFMLIWIVTLIVIRYAKNRSHSLKNFIDGEPITLIDEGKFQVKGYEKSNLSNTEIESLLRSKGVSGIHRLYSLTVEPNGSISYVEKGEREYAVILVDQGKIHPFALDYLEKDEPWLEKVLAEHGFFDIEKLFCVEWDGKKMWITPYAEHTKEE